MAKEIKVSVAKSTNAASSLQNVIFLHEADAQKLGSEHARVVVGGIEKYCYEIRADGNGVEGIAEMSNIQRTCNHLAVKDHITLEAEEAIGVFGNAVEFAIKHYIDTKKEKVVLERKKLQSAIWNAWGGKPIMQNQQVVIEYDNYLLLEVTVKKMMEIYDGDQFGLGESAVRLLGADVTMTFSSNTSLITVAEVVVEDPTLPNLQTLLKKMNAYLASHPDVKKERFVEGFIFYEQELPQFAKEPEKVITRDTLHGWLRTAVNAAKSFKPHVSLVQLHFAPLADYYNSLMDGGGVVEAGNSVYLITEKPFSGFFKVGMVTTGTLHERLHDLQTGNPRELVMLEHVRCKDPATTMALETLLHVAFKERRAVGEWFACDVEKDLEYIRILFRMLSSKALLVNAEGNKDKVIKK